MKRVSPNLSHIHLVRICDLGQKGCDVVLVNWTIGARIRSK
jgi:hypothetical protein